MALLQAGKHFKGEFKVTLYIQGISFIIKSKYFFGILDFRHINFITKYDMLS